MMCILTQQEHALIVDALENVYGKGKLCDAALAMLKAMKPVAQAAQPAPRRLTEAEITLLVEAYYEDVGTAPPDLIRQVERVIFGDVHPAQHTQVPDGYVLVPVEPTGAMVQAVGVNGSGAYERLVYKAMLAAAPSTKEGQQ